MQEIPYVGIPAVRVMRPSVAPVDIEGTTGTLPHKAWTVSSMARVTSGSRGEGGTVTSLTSEPSAACSGTSVTTTFGSATARSIVLRMLSGSSPGKIRQLTLARAVCGRAFGAWPPESMVATQVAQQSVVVRNGGQA